jgi:hypothetical protein
MTFFKLLFDWLVDGVADHIGGELLVFGASCHSCS